MFKQYEIFQLLIQEELNQFDPLRDLLTGKYFYTWRKVGQGRPKSGLPIAHMARSNRAWVPHPYQNFEYYRIDDFVQRWLTSQLRSEDTLGAWETSPYRGLFEWPGDSLPRTRERLQLYNRLIVELQVRLHGAEKVAVVDVACPQSKLTHFSFAPDGQLNTWNDQNTTNLLQFWSSICPLMLNHVRQIHLGAFDPNATVSITIGNAD